MSFIKSKFEKKFLVIGLDGACWNLIDPWIRNGELPNIKKLREEGCWGPLKSCVPPVTFPAWKCYSTGKNPGKLGVFWWQHIDLEKKDVKFPNSNSFKSLEIWDYLNRQRIKTGVIGMPGTFPPREIDGFMVSGGPDSGSRGYAYPKDLEIYLKKMDYKVHPLIKDNLKEGSPLIDEILELISLQFRIAKLLLVQKPVDFLHITIFYLNWLQHYFYQDNPVKEAWKLIDNEIGEIMEMSPFIMIMSDHGTAPMRKTFFINAWLEREGYLHLNNEKTIADYFFKLGINKETAFNFLKTIRLSGFMSRFEVVKALARRFLLDSEGELSDRAGKTSIANVNWRKTKVVGLPQGPLYINREIIKDENTYEKLRSELINRLEKLKDPEDKQNPIKKVYRREEIYQGEFVKNAPDLVALDSDEYHNRGGVGKRDIFQGSGWKGNNARYGLFICRGPGIKKDSCIENVSIYDLAPTILYLMDCPVPGDMDGKVLKEIFKK